MIATRRISATAKLTVASVGGLISSNVSAAQAFAQASTSRNTSNNKAKRVLGSAQVPKIPASGNLPDEEAERQLLAEVEGLKRQNRMRQLEGRLALARRDNVGISSSRNPSQALLGNIEAAGLEFCKDYPLKPP